MPSLSTVSVWNSTLSSSLSFSIPSPFKIFFESLTYSLVRGYSTYFTLTTKIDNFLGSSHVTDTFIGISNPPCTNGEAIGFSLWTSASNLAPSPIENRYIERALLVRTQQQLTLSSLSSWPFQRLQLCCSGYYALYLERYFLSNIRFRANSVWVCMVPS